MPSNSQFTINNFSPDFRDALLNRNLLADTVTNNSLSSWLDGINSIPDIGDGVGLIKGSGDIETEGPIYRKGDVKYSKITGNEYYNGTLIDYYTKEIEFPPVGYGIYMLSPIASPTINSEFYRDDNTLLNIFKSGIPEYSTNDIIEYIDTNIVTKTDYIDNSLFSGQNSPVVNSSLLREPNVLQNRYQQATYENIIIDLLPTPPNPVFGLLGLDPNTYSLAGTLEAYTSNFVPESGPFQGGNIRQFNTANNMYLDVDKQTTVNLNTTPVANIQYKSYLDENGNLNYGGTGSVQLSNALASISDFASGSFGTVPDFDVRNSIVGRALTSGGVLSDTRLGQISPKFLGDAIRNNIGFNLREETLGRINTNPLSLAMGGSLIVPNNKITVASTTLGKGLGFLEKITGGKIPVSLLQRDADIFSYNTKGYIGVGNIQRANAILKNTGKGTVSYLLGNIKASINTNFTGNRQGYAPAFDGGGDNKISDSDAKLYALYDGKDGGIVKDILKQTKENSPVPQSSYNLEGMVNNSGFEDGVKNITNWIFTRKGKTSASNIDTGFTWSDEKHNKLARDISPTFNGDEFGRTEESKKSILYKTQELFNSGNMRTLVSGKGIPASDKDETTTITKGFMSKGSAVLANGAETTGKTGDDLFARAWSPVDRYDEYADLQKNSALSPEGRVDANLNIESSVLREAGVVQIGPYSDDNNIKRFMFSLENLAWSDSLTKLLPCEIGPGDPLIGRSGRIMWFPPYDIAINESVSASYDRTNFIGRGEPIYTYNNTERTGTLSWKIVVDHPNYINFFKSGENEDYASFFAGALGVKEIRNRLLSTEEKAKYEIAEANKLIQGVPKQIKPKFEFNVYYPNDNSEVPYYDSSVIVTGSNINSYESGRDYDGNFIDYGQHPSGIVYDTVEILGVTNATTGFTKVYGMKTTTRDGGKTDIDNTNFGLNGTSNPIKLSMSDIEELDGWYGFEDLRTGDDLDNYFISKEGNCRYCRFTIKGYASPQGNFEANKILAKKRGDNLKQHIIDTIGVDAKRITVLKAEAIQQSGCKQDSSKDIKECKEDRKVTISIAYDSKLEKEDNPNPNKRDPNEPDPKFTIPLSRFYTECDYFEKIKDTDKFVYSQFKDKIKNFHPAFHAITPEGFNSRLTFLQQCMRQGPTDGDNPDNLAFGKPPVCILRLGDFYHTKIIIESLTIDYEPIVWDLNPEGIGVQPMIANVNISFAFIGGSSMKGPINRLQNAISFNYFANTELYDPRAERIKDGKIIEGNFPFSKDVIDRLEAEKKDQKEVELFENARRAAEAASNANIKAEEEFLKALANDQEILKAITINSYKVTESISSFALIIGINKNDKITDTGLQREYYAEFFIKDSKTNQNLHIGFVIAKPINDTSFLIEVESFTDGREKDEATFEMGDKKLTIGFLEFSTLKSTYDGTFDDPKATFESTIVDLLSPCGTFETPKPPALPVGPLASNVNTGFIPTTLSNILPVFKPCKSGPHMLVLKWYDDLGFETSSKRVYTRANNELSND